MVQTHMDLKWFPQQQQTKEEKWGWEGQGGQREKGKGTEIDGGVDSAKRWDQGQEPA